MAALSGQRGVEGRGSPKYSAVAALSVAWRFFTSSVLRMGGLSLKHPHSANRQRCVREARGVKFNCQTLLHSMQVRATAAFQEKKTSTNKKEIEKRKKRDERGGKADGSRTGSSTNKTEIEKRKKRDERGGKADGSRTGSRVLSAL